MICFNVTNIIMTRQKLKFIHLFDHFTNDNVAKLVIKFLLYKRFTALPLAQALKQMPEVL